MAATAEAPTEGARRAEGRGLLGPGHDAHRRDARPAAPAAARPRGGQARREADHAPGHRRDPRRAARRASWRKVGIGRSALEPAKGDRRFKDDAWRGNPAFKRLLQAYLATGQAVDGLIGDAGLDWRSERQVRFAAENVLDALAPTNAPLTNPAVLKAALDTGGRNFARGARQLRARHGQAAADPVDGRHVGVHGRRGHRGHAGRGRAAHARCSSSCSTSRRPRRCASSRCCSRRR